jgi:hypothetical protein
MSGFSVNFGRDSAGNTVYRKVPCTYGDPSRQTAQIMRANSTNTTITVPQISCYITEFKYSRERIQDPNYVKKTNVIRRAIDPVTGNYLNQPGSKFTVERLMPVPYDLTVKADIWCSNTDQKMQLMEQICTLFNPSMELQGTDNFLDWTSISLIELQSTTWSSRSVPVGTDDQIDVANMTFNMPIWLSTPAKVKKLGVITNVITDIYDSSGMLRQDLLEQGFKASDFIFDSALEGGGSTMGDFVNPVTTDGDWHENVPVKQADGTTRLESVAQVSRPVGLRTSLKYSVIVMGNIATLVSNRAVQDQGPNGNLVPIDNTELAPWQAVLAQTVNYQEGVTRLYLRQNDQHEVVGTVASNHNDGSQLLLAIDLDTIPSNTLAAVDRIINPLTAAPANQLPPASSGQRYLILNDIGSNLNANGAQVWKGTDNSDLVALQYDIIQYDGVKWIVAFRAAGTSQIQYVTNLTTGQQFKWTSQEWIRSYEGLYGEGEWRLD